MFIVLAAGVAWSQGEVNMPLGGTSGVEGLTPVPIGGLKVKTEMVAGADGDRAALKVSFDKPGEERRFLALERPLKGMPTGTKAVAIRYRLKIEGAEAVRPALVVFEKGGGVWYKVAAPVEPSPEFTDGRLSVASLAQAAFSQDASGQIEWDNLDKVWLGLIIDGAAKGTFELSDARLTSEPYKPTQPLRVTGDGPGVWTVSKDPAAEGTVTTPNEGPDGKPCMRFDFTFPGGRHMFALPSTIVPAFDLEGYTALRFKYRAVLPEGLKGLLVSVVERDGSQYCVEPPASAEWTTLTVPFADLKLGGWSRDENDRLDIDQIGSIIIGTHGTAKVGGTGTIWAADIEFVP